MNWCKLCVLLCSCTLSCNVLIITTTAALQLFHHAASCMQTQCRVLSLTLPLSFFDPAMHGAQKRAMAASHREFCHERQARENRWAAAVSLPFLLDRPKVFILHASPLHLALATATTAPAVCASTSCWLRRPADRPARGLSPLSHPPRPPRRPGMGCIARRTAA